MADRCVWAGRFIEVHVDGRWEYVARARSIGAAVILAVDAGHVLLVEQYRVPLGRNCLELPAGLIGDWDEADDVLQSAARELEEETGFRAAEITVIGEFCSSPGLTSESFHLVRATGLKRIGEGGGVDGENILVHRVALDAVPDFVAAKRAEGCAIDAKIMVFLPLLGESTSR